MNKIIFVILLLALLVPVSAVTAQSAPSVVDTTIPVDPGVRAAVDAWLSTSAPIQVPNWVITYVGKPDESGNTFVSLVAVTITDLDTKWHLTDDNIVAWMGSITIAPDASIDLYSDGGYASKSGAKLAAPMLDGGGANVRFPWEGGASIMYGTRGVHNAGGGASYAQGFYAVDFLGGDDLGSGVASNKVYAAATGQVDYVCQDETTTLIRTSNTNTGDYYIYAHLLDNVNLTEGYTFSQSSLIGSLKYGSFDDNCGWADQTPLHYHLHFGFKFSSGFFTMEGCTLGQTSQKWTCGSKTVSTGQFLSHGGGAAVPGDDDDGATDGSLSFWDYTLAGAVEMWDTMIVQNMPDHTTTEFLYVLYNAIRITLRIVRVLVYSNINLSHLMRILILGAAIKAVFGIAEFIVFLFKAWKSLVPIIGA